MDSGSESNYPTPTDAASSRNTMDPYIGSRVFIKKCDKRPHRVGTEATIIDIPVHPNTWYRVQFDDRTEMRLRQSSFQPVDQKQTGIIQDEQIVRTASTSSSSQKSPFQVGVRVRIRDTANVRHRVSHLISSRGVITNIPTHPNTWYEVQMDDKAKGQVKFQATALVLEDDEDDGMNLDDNMSNSPGATACNDDGTPTERLPMSHHLLSDTDPLLWIGQKVVLKCGPMQGETAIVKKSGNGWVQLRIARTGQDVARRAYELVVPEESPLLDGLGYPVNGSQIRDSPDSQDMDDDTGSVKNEGDSKRESRRRRDSPEFAADDDDLVGKEVVIINGVHANCMGVIASGNGYWYINISDTEKVRKKREQFEVLYDIEHLFRKLVPDGDNDIYETFQEVQYRDPEDESMVTGTIVKFSSNHFKVELENGAKSALRFRDEVTFVKAPLDVAKLLAGSRVVEPKFNITDDAMSNTTDRRSTSARSDSAIKDQKRQPRESSRRLAVANATSATTTTSSSNNTNVTRNTKSTRSRNLPISDDPSVHQLLEANRMRTEMMTIWMENHRQKLVQYNRHRPNLKMWLDRVQGDDEVEDKYIPPLAKVQVCLICRLEKTSTNDHCWNPACWKSPVFEPGARPLDVSQAALPSINKRSRSDYVFAVAQSPRKPGFIEVPEAAFPFFYNINGLGDGLESTQEEEEEEESQRVNKSDCAHVAKKAMMKGWGRFVAGRKRIEEDIIFSPLETHRLRAYPCTLGRGHHPEAPARDLGLNGYFGAGWNDELARPFVHCPKRRKSDDGTDSLSVSDSEDDECDEDLSGLDFRWRGWSNRNLQNPTDDAAKVLMDLKYVNVVDASNLKLVNKQKETIITAFEEMEAKRLAEKSRPTTPVVPSGGGGGAAAAAGPILPTPKVMTTGPASRRQGKNAKKKSTGAANNASGMPTSAQMRSLGGMPLYMIGSSANANAATRNNMLPIDLSQFTGTGGNFDINMAMEHLQAQSGGHLPPDFQSYGQLPQSALGSAQTLQSNTYLMQQLYFQQLQQLQQQQQAQQTSSPAQLQPKPY